MEKPLARIFAQTATGRMTKKVTNTSNARSNAFLCFATPREAQWHVLMPLHLGEHDLSNKTH